MKVICVCFLLMSLMALSQGFSQPIIPNTKAEGCVNGVCGPHCSWEDVKLFPNESLNQPGKCNILRCTDDFSIVISPCPFDSKCGNLLSVF